MPTIDGENAKQIREPMDVLIQMDARSSLALTYSGYSSSAKVTDGSLNRPEWKMRKIADLQGDGFPLNGTHVLYNSATTASSSNGHIGVRGHIGQPVVITVTATTTIPTISIVVSGAATISAGGSSYNAAGGSLIIPVENTTVTLTFTPAQADKRVEVSGIVAGTYLRIGNEALIRCVVSLRSDLSIINPTLPESEINIECFNDADVSEYVAQIPEDTPITYSAGYPGDMSEERRFYTIDQVTWSDNVLSLQGVDAVRKLGMVSLEDVLLQGMLSEWDVTPYVPTPRDVRSYITGVLQLAGIDFSEAGAPAFQFATSSSMPNGIVKKDGGARSAIAELMNLFHIDGLKTYSGLESFWLTYVDAGIPLLRARKPGMSGAISVADIADWQRNTERKIGTLILRNSNITVPHLPDNRRFQKSEAGKVSWVKGSGGFIELDRFTVQWQVGYVPENNPSNLTFPLLPVTSESDWETETPSLPGVYWEGPRYMFDGDTPQVYDTDAYPKAKIYTQVIPWSARYDATQITPYNSMAEAWNGLVQEGVIASDETTVDLVVYGTKAAVDDVSYEATSGIGETVEIDPLLIGAVYTANASSSEDIGPAGQKVYPNMAMSSLLDRSPNTGEFKWKGDPRMQPRDVVELVNLDGSTTVITLENITLTHEGGGLSAEITYREGVV